MNARVTAANRRPLHPNAAFATTKLQWGRSGPGWRDELVDHFWDAHPWLIIILAVLAVPVVQALFEPWRRYLTYRERREAIETLKVYASQNREPPPEVLAALGGKRWRRRAMRAAAAGVSVGAEAARAAGDSVSGGWSEAWWNDRADRWRRAEPIRRWNWAIFTGAITAGFAYASQHVHSGADTYMIVAIIAGALTIAGVLSALIATFWRID